MIGDAFQIARISLLKGQVLETCLGGAPVPCFHQVAGNVDPHNFHSRPGQRNRRSAIPPPRSNARSGGFTPSDSTTASPDGALTRQSR